MVLSACGMTTCQRHCALLSPEAARRLALPRVNGLDAGADDLGDVGRAVAHERDGDAQELLLVERGDKLRQCKIEEVEL